jgi:ribonuclease HII
LTIRLWNNLIQKGPEEELRALGYRLIAGVDEAGRGALAGPVFAAAVILPPEFTSTEIKDSKLLSPKKREELFEFIVENALAYAISKADPEEINSVGIMKATFKAMARALANLEIKPEVVLVDGPHSIPEYKGLQKCVVKGDRLCLSIAAASILAKVSRDRYMCKMEKLFPGFSFSKHKGYATKEHFAQIEKFGPSPIHRTYYRCFKR